MDLPWKKLNKIFFLRVLSVLRGECLVRVFSLVRVVRVVRGHLLSQ